jgi:hypothetical protein
MPIIDYIDGSNRRIYLSSDTVNSEIHPIDIYKEMRTLRRTDENLRRFELFIEASGFEAKGGGAYTQRLVKLLSGTRIVPHDSTHVLTITGEIITDEGTSGVGCFDRGLLSSEMYVDINYVPPQVEVVVINTGSGVTAQDKEDIAELSRQEIDANSTRLAAIKAKTDTIPSDPASNTQVNTRLAASAYVAPANSDITAIKAKTDTIPSGIASETNATSNRNAILAEIESLSVGGVDMDEFKRKVAAIIIALT